MPINSEYLEFMGEVEAGIRGRHAYVFENLEYGLPTDDGEDVSMSGEIDFLGYDNDGTLTIYEMKSSRKPKPRVKGLNQLWRARRFFQKYGLKIDKEEKEISRIVLVLEMYGPDKKGKLGRERIEIED